jgi:hypothetical protein
VTSPQSPLLGVAGGRNDALFPLPETIDEDETLRIDSGLCS